MFHVPAFQNIIQNNKDWNSDWDEVNHFGASFQNIIQNNKDWNLYVCNRFRLETGLPEHYPKQ